MFIGFNGTVNYAINKPADSSHRVFSSCETFAIKLRLIPSSCTSELDIWLKASANSPISSWLVIGMRFEKSPLAMLRAASDISLKGLVSLKVIAYIEKNINISGIADESKNIRKMLPRKLLRLEAGEEAKTAPTVFPRYHTMVCQWYKNIAVFVV